MVNHVNLKIVKPHQYMDIFFVKNMEVDYVVPNPIVKLLQHANLVYVKNMEVDVDVWNQHANYPLKEKLIIVNVIAFRMRCKHTECKNAAFDRSGYCTTHGGGRKCIEPNCQTRAFGKYEYCIKHGAGEPCIEPDCKNIKQGKTDYCKRHGGGIRCQFKDCTSSAYDGTHMCRIHGGGGFCKYPGCSTSSRDKTDFCILHGGGKLCRESDCKQSSQGKTDYCIKHGGGHRCIYPNCKLSSRFANDYCSNHGGGKRCTYPECESTATTTGNKNFCTIHGGGIRCPNCIDYPDSRSGKPKYNGYCATCFKREFPDDPRSTRIHSNSPEIRVRNAISERSIEDPQFKGFIHNMVLYTGHCDCTHKRRIDHRKLFGNTFLAIETDEHAHRSYDEKDEQIRYDDLYMIHSGKWIYIRFNPDHTRYNKTDLDDRLEVLLDTIEYQIHRIEREENTELVEIIKLFY